MLQLLTQRMITKDDHLLQSDECDDEVQRYTRHCHEMLPLCVFDDDDYELHMLYDN